MEAATFSFFYDFEHEKTRFDYAGLVRLLYF